MNSGCRSCVFCMLCRCFYCLVLKLYTGTRSNSRITWNFLEKLYYQIMRVGSALHTTINSGRLCCCIAVTTIKSCGFKLKGFIVCQHSAFFANYVFSLYLSNKFKFYSWICCLTCFYCHFNSRSLITLDYFMLSQRFDDAK